MRSLLPSNLICYTYVFCFIKTFLNNSDQTLWPVRIQNLTSEIMNLFLDILVGLLGRGIGSSSQDHYLQRIAQHRKTGTYIHASSEIRTHDARVRAVKDSMYLRPHGHWDLLIKI